MSDDYYVIDRCEKHGCQMRMTEIGRGKTVPVCDKCVAEARAGLDSWPVFQYLKATSDTTAGQMVPWAEYQRKQNELDRLCAKASRAVTMYEEEITTLRARVAALEEAGTYECGLANSLSARVRELEEALGNLVTACSSAELVGWEWFDAIRAAYQDASRLLRLEVEP